MAGTGSPRDLRRGAPRWRQALVWQIPLILIAYPSAYVLLCLCAKPRYVDHGGSGFNQVLRLPIGCFSDNFDLSKSLCSQLTLAGDFFTPLILVQDWIIPGSFLRTMSDVELRNFKCEVMLGNISFRGFGADTYATDNGKRNINPLKTMDLSNPPEYDALKRVLLAGRWEIALTMTGKHMPIVFSADGTFGSRGDFSDGGEGGGAWRFRGGLLEIYDDFGNASTRWSYDGSTGEFLLAWVDGTSGKPRHSNRLVPFAATP